MAVSDSEHLFICSSCKHYGDAWSLSRLLGRTSAKETNCYMNNCRIISSKKYMADLSNIIRPPILLIDISTLLAP